MNKVINSVVSKMLFLVVLASVFCLLGPSAFALQRFEDDSVAITTKLPPQYLGWKVEAGSTTQNVPWYYKISAVVPQIGETVTGSVTTAMVTYAGALTSTQSVRLMWAPVDGATSYKLYRSADNSAFYLIETINAPTLTFVDAGEANGAAYSAPTPRGGNLSVEKDLSVGGNLSLTGNMVYTGYGAMTPKTKAQIEAITPSQAGQFYACSDCIDAAVCISTGTGVSAWVQISSKTVACN